MLVDPASSLTMLHRAARFGVVNVVSASWRARPVELTAISLRLSLFVKNLYCDGPCTPVTPPRPAGIECSNVEM
ncbi:hypothetical protein [Streptomyces cellulosae]|uniref:hypothetical protein n=1 Tax=Streptomyces cellulosae TaxID=1968 RepID=UPI00131D3438|nr:hypothetical protein [Streptomyces cellulosae]